MAKRKRKRPRRLPRDRDLMMAQHPAGGFAIFEVVDNLLAFGDVTFELPAPPNGLIACGEARSPAVDRLLGKPFATQKAVIDAVNAVDAQFTPKHRVYWRERITRDDF